MIGQSVYTLAEAARYTEVPQATLRTWFLRRSDGRGHGPLFEADYPAEDGDFAIGFVNLIEAYVASFFKKNRVKPLDIRLTNEKLKRTLNDKHPFAHADLSTGLGRVIYEASRGTKEGARLTEVISNQLVFPEFKDGLHRIKYNPTTKRAAGWEIRPGIIVNPNMGFGKPVIENAGVSTLIVAHQYIANNRDAATVARLFNVSPASVISAFEFERELNRIAA